MKEREKPSPRLQAQVPGVVTAEKGEKILAYLLLRAHHPVGSGEMEAQSLRFDIVTVARGSA